MSFFCINCKSATSPEYKACPFCGEPITDFLRRYLAAPIDGKYKIISRLGVGGMGEVYKVLHLHLNALRVVKLMRASMSKEASANERFVREARLATRINHPNVATLFDFATLDDGTHYMVWEFIEGMTLGEMLRVRGALSPKYAAQLSIQALAGLEAVHRSGVVHRDISPENIMITRDDEGLEMVKIIDLGIAKQSSEGNDSHTQTGMFVGKWKYCSPEQLGVMKEGESIDRRADLYSFGICLYEMLTGQAPFSAESPHRYVLMHATESPKPLSEIRPELGKASELEALVFRALEKDRDRRFASARQFASALEAVLPQLADLPARPDLKRRSEDEETAEHALVADTALTSANNAPRHEEPPPTVMATSSGTPHRAGEQTLFGSAQEAEAEPPNRSIRWWPAAAALTLLVGGSAALWPMLHRPPASTPVTPARVAEAATGVLSVPKSELPPARVVVNSFPWSEISAIHRPDGSSLAVQDQVTPAVLMLSPGDYDITLKQQSGESQTRHVQVAASGDNVLNVEFHTAESLPSFGGEQ